jgi:hypothetical protein
MTVAFHEWLQYRAGHSRAFNRTTIFGGWRSLMREA